MTLYEPISGRFFTATEDEVNELKQKLRKQFLDDGYLYINDIYNALAKLAKEKGMPFEEHVWACVEGMPVDESQVIDLKDANPITDDVCLTFDLNVYL